MSRMRTGSFWLVVLALVAVVVWTAPSSTAGERLSVRIDEPFEINGEIFPAGKLSLREVGDASPATSLHEFRVDGFSHGLLVVRFADTAAVARSTEFVFARSTDGHLVLEGLAVAGEPMGTVRAFDAPAGPDLSADETPRATEIASNH